jgi:hypothetical protein
MFKVNALDAVVDYILAEPDPTIKFANVKSAFIETIVKRCAEEPIPSMLHIVRLVQRILDNKNIFNQWYLSAIEVFYFKFKLCQRLTAMKSYDLIESLLNSLLKHRFINDQCTNKTQTNWQAFLSQRLFSQLSCDSNKLNDESTMLAIRPKFQQIYR